MQTRGMRRPSRASRRRALPLPTCRPQRQRSASPNKVSSRQRRMRLSARLVILYNWNVIGWQRGIIQRRVYDGRIKRTNMQCNFYLWYEVDDEEVPTALRIKEHGGVDGGAWVLLVAAGGA